MVCRHYIKRSGQLDEDFTVLYPHQGSHWAPGRAVTFKNRTGYFTSSTKKFKKLVEK